MVLKTFLLEHYLGYRVLGMGIMGYVYLIMPEIIAYSIRNSDSPTRLDSYNLSKYALMVLR